MIKQIIDGVTITNMRTAAASAVALKVIGAISYELL
jgi:ornithine cyclodeaminase/alanine dehydrogenase-like protein (mu-crystallin family)